MLKIAHRGFFDSQNTISSIKQISNFVDFVEIDVRYNTKREIVLCHDRENRNDSANETLEQLLNSNPLNLMIDIKAFGTIDAIHLASDIHNIIIKYPQHNYLLCSFNEYCVNKLLELKNFYKVGVISSGISMGMYSHLKNLDFVSLDYSIICENIVNELHSKNYHVYSWVVNNDNMISYVNDCNIDGIIKDYYSNEYNLVKLSKIDKN